MPKVFEHGSLKFYFYSNEGDPREPVHIHVRAHGANAKIWLDPAIGVAESSGFNRGQQTVIIRLVIENHSRIRKAWHDHFGD